MDLAVIDFFAKLLLFLLIFEFLLFLFSDFSIFDLTPSELAFKLNDFVFNFFVANLGS